MSLLRLHPYPHYSSVEYSWSSAATILAIATDDGCDLQLRWPLQGHRLRHRPCCHRGPLRATILPSLVSQLSFLDIPLCWGCDRLCVIGFASFDKRVRASSASFRISASPPF
jgi:hypothetical protein